jgi:cysteine-S-conjugate beta-lyase
MSYDFDSVTERRGTASLKWDFDERFTGVKDLLPLWVADMDFKAPPEIVGALQRRLDHGIYGYTVEPESYFEAARTWMATRHGWEIRREWMVPSPGVIPCLSAAILALTAPGDGIVIQPPVYHPFALRITGNGRRVLENPLRLVGNRWEMDLDGLSRVIDSGTRMLVLCSPHNPVGRVWERATLERLARICAERGVVIVSDEIHSDLVMSGHRHVPLATVSDAAAANSVTLVAATKTFNLAGIGGSLAIVPDPEIRRRLDAMHHNLFTGLATAPGVVACEAAWRTGAAWLDELLVCIEANYRFLVDQLAAHLPKARVFPLEGTYLALVDLRGLGLPDARVREILLKEAGVWLDEGAKFGRGGEGMQRLNLACPRTILSDGLRRMTAALSAADGKARA